MIVSIDLAIKTESQCASAAEFNTFPSFNLYMTKLLEVAIVIVGLTLGSAIAWAEQAPSTQQLDSFMRLENLEGPFVTKAFAEELAILVLREKYPKRLFVGGRPCEVADSGDIWLVTVRNKLPQKAGQLIPKRFVVHIRKTNGEIVTIS